MDDLDAASVAEMPAANELLVAAGMSFAQFFAPTPLCCPSRVAFLRGQYVHNHAGLRNTGEDAAFAQLLAPEDTPLPMIALDQAPGAATM